MPTVCRTPICRSEVSELPQPSGAGVMDKLQTPLFSKPSWPPPRLGDQRTRTRLRDSQCACTSTQFLCAPQHPSSPHESHAQLDLPTRPHLDAMSVFYRFRRPSSSRAHFVATIITCGGTRSRLVPVRSPRISTQGKSRPGSNQPAWIQ